MTTIENNVMRRVYRIRILYAVFSGVTASCFLFLLSLWGIGREVWVAAVFENGPQDLVGRAQYLFYAFLQTDLIVQVLCLVVLGSIIYLAYQTARLIASSLVPARA